MISPRTGTPAADVIRTSPIDAKAKDLAAKQLERLAAREAVKAAEPVSMKRKSPERPPETPEQLRARIRTSLMRRKA
jgi:hypothetical protein